MCLPDVNAPGGVSKVCDLSVVKLGRRRFVRHYAGFDHGGGLSHTLFGGGRAISRHATDVVMMMGGCARNKVWAKTLRAMTEDGMEGLLDKSS